MKRINAFFGLLLFSITISAQQSLSLRDSRTEDAVPFAHVMIQPLQMSDTVANYLTDIDGNANIQVKQSSIIHISCIGYKTAVDTIGVENNYLISLVPDVFDLDAVVVTANCAPKKVDRSIYDIQVIGRKKINDQGAENLKDLLSTELNMRINNDGALGSSVSFQGLSGEHLKILIDGVPLIGRKNGNLDLSQINLNNVDHIEVIQGPMSTVYGSNALAGVINIITKEGRGEKWSSDLVSYMESVGVYNYEGRFGLNFKRHRLDFGIGRNFFDGFDVEQDTRSMLWKPKRQIFGDINYSILHEKYKLKLGFRLFDELLQDKGDLAAPYYETAFDQYFYTQRSNLKLDYFKSFKKKHNLNVLLSYSKYKWTKQGYFKDLTTLNEVISSADDHHDSTFITSWLSRGVFSNDQQNNKFQYQLGYDFNLEIAEGKRIKSRSQSIGDYAVFASAQWKIHPQMSLQPGIRWSYNTKYLAPIVYSINALWEPKNFKIRASWAKGFRSPSIKELYLDFHDINHNIIGNQDLKAEYSNNYNTSISWRGEHKQLNFQLGLKTFYNDIKNIISLALMPDGSYTYTNLESYQTWGFDLLPTINLYPRLNIKLGYGLVGIRNNLDINTQKDFLYSPNFTGGLEYRIPKIETRFIANYKYTGALPQIYLNSDNQLVETSLDPYHTLDISFSKKLVKNRLNLSVGAKNLFNNTIIANASIGGVHSGGNQTPIGWGRTYFISFSYLFKKYQ